MTDLPMSAKIAHVPSIKIATYADAMLGAITFQVLSDFNNSTDAIS